MITLNLTDERFARLKQLFDEKKLQINQDYSGMDEDGYPIIPVGCMIDDKGCRCAVGALFTDEELDSIFKGDKPARKHAGTRALIWHNYITSDEGMILEEIQGAHDIYMGADGGETHFRNKFNSIMEENNKGYRL